MRVLQRRCALRFDDYDTMPLMLALTIPMLFIRFGTTNRQVLSGIDAVWGVVVDGGVVAACSRATVSGPQPSSCTTSG